VPVTVTFEDWAWNVAYARCAARRDVGAIAPPLGCSVGESPIAISISSLA
jgi:hypothetical protein